MVLRGCRFLGTPSQPSLELRAAQRQRWQGVAESRVPGHATQLLLALWLACASRRNLIGVDRCHDCSPSHPYKGS